MLDIDELNEKIKELEDNAETFSDYEKLANLYIVRNSRYNYENNNMEELNDILPQYKNYCMLKKKYQLNELPEQTVIYAMEDVCKEIKDFILSLYNNTINKKERYTIKNTLEDLLNILE